jgi:hypothetical protein
MSWRERVRAIKVGDTVAYSRAFLQSISCYTGDLPQAKGRVIGLEQLSKDLTLAEIEWDRPDLPARVNVSNLCKTNSKAFGR